MTITENYLAHAKSLFSYYKNLGDRTLEQLNDEQVNDQINPVSNSIASIVKHLNGNMLSRWTDFLNSDGEKPWRQREQEFENELPGLTAVKNSWEQGWQCLFQALGSLSAHDLDRIVYIRNEGHTVLEAINRQLAHYAYHVGQIVFLAKTMKGDDWVSLSIPKGQSAAFNREKFNREKTRKNFV